MHIKDDANDDPEISADDWVEGNTKAKGANEFIPVVANPENDTANNEEGGQQNEADGFIFWHVIDKCCVHEEEQQHLLYCVGNIALVDICGGVCT